MLKKALSVLLILCNLLVFCSEHALADNWVKTDAKGNVWVDTSHYENQPKWIDTSYWTTNRVLVPSGYWQTNQTLLSAGYWDIKSTLVTPGQWKYSQVLVKDGYWNTQQVKVKDGYWTYKNVIDVPAHQVTKRVWVKEGYWKDVWGDWFFLRSPFTDGMGIYTSLTEWRDPWSWGNRWSFTEYHEYSEYPKLLHYEVKSSTYMKAFFDVGREVQRSFTKIPQWGRYVGYSGGYTTVQRFQYAECRLIRLWIDTSHYEYKTVTIPTTYKKVKDQWIPDQYKDVPVWIYPVYRTDKIWVAPVYKTTQVWVPPVYNTTKTWIDTSSYKDVSVYVSSGYWGTEQAWVTSGFNFNPQGTVSISKWPTYVFTQKAKLQDGSPAYMDLTVNWSGMNEIVTGVKSYHDVERYKNRGTIRVNGVLLTSSLNSTLGKATFRFTYPYAALPTSKIYVEIILKNGAVVRTNAAVPVNSFLGTYNENAPDPVWYKSIADTGSISF